MAAARATLFILTRCAASMLAAVAAAAALTPTKPQAETNEENAAALARTVRRIQAALDDAEEQEQETAGHDLSAELWRWELQGVVNDAEDALDEHRYLRLQQQQQQLTRVEASANRTSRPKKRKREAAQNSSSSSVSLACAQAGVAKRFRKIEERFDEIAKDRRALRLGDEDGERRPLRSVSPAAAGSSSLVDESTVVGRQHDKEKVVEQLISANVSNFAVIAIVGMGGLGKTTLAQLVYNDSQVHLHFNRRAWVSASKNFDITRLTKATIESMTNQPCALTELSALQDKLRNETEAKSVLLVLDDVWDEKLIRWDCFRAPLICAETVRVLITSRSTSVAKNIQTMPFYRLDFLPEDQSIMLFQQHAFDSQHPSAHPNLLEIGDKIVKKCGGLPLALKTFGGHLRHEVDEEKWRDTLESEIWELEEGRDCILPALRSSYSRLPKHLKQCFLYFSAFPKGHEFQKDTMIRLWIAHGFVYPKANKSLEKIGRECFDELQGRLLLECFRENGRDVYRVHDMVHDLAKSIFGRKAEKEKSRDISNTVRHLYCRGNHMLHNFVSNRNPRTLRSLLNYSLDVDPVSSQIITKLACLRVLELNLHGLDELPDSIGGLKHLRYLRVIGHNLRRLPESVCLLYNLQTLDLQHCSSLLELPEAIGNLINLRYIRLRSTKIERLPETVSLLSNLRLLDLNSCYRLKELPGSINQLTGLCSLDISHTAVCRIPYGLRMFSSLRKLGATLEAESRDMCRGLSELKNLVNLKGTLCISGLEHVVDLEHVKTCY